MIEAICDDDGGGGRGRERVGGPNTTHQPVPMEAAHPKEEHGKTADSSSSFSFLQMLLLPNLLMCFADCPTVVVVVVVVVFCPLHAVPCRTVFVCLLLLILWFWRHWHQRQRQHTGNQQSRRSRADAFFHSFLSFFALFGRQQFCLSTVYCPVCLSSVWPSYSILAAAALVAVNCLLFLLSFTGQTRHTRHGLPAYVVGRVVPSSLLPFSCCIDGH